MWKFVTRGIRESLERRVCRTNVYSQSSQDGSGSGSPEPGSGSLTRREHGFGPPCLSAFYHGYAGKDTRQLGARDEDERRNYDAKYSWSEAVGWSSVLAIGYVVCQSILIRRKLFDIDSANLEKWRKKLITDPQIHATQLLSHLLLPKPQYVLPVSTEPINEQSIDITGVSEDLVDGVSSVQQAYGPITAQEAFKEAVDQFTQAHEMVMGELEFNGGVQAVEEKRYEDAVGHFLAGAKMSSVRSMFNLGLCYELGLGTFMDYEKAAEYYKKAADRGHVDAMYNLGVFHAQGKGSIRVNLDTARYWFTEAANKGQIKAIKALQMEQNFKKQTEQNIKGPLKVQNMKNVGSNVVIQLINYRNIFNASSDTHQTESYEFSNSYTEDVNSVTPTDIFLDMLGVQRAIPLLSVGESGV